MSIFTTKLLEKIKKLTSEEPEKPSLDQDCQDAYIQVLEEKNAHISRLLDISEAQKNNLKKQCAMLRESMSELMSENNP